MSATFKLSWTLAFAIQWTIASRRGPISAEFLEHYTGDWTLRLLLVTLG